MPPIDLLPVDGAKYGRLLKSSDVTPLEFSGGLGGANVAP